MDGVTAQVRSSPVLGFKEEKAWHFIVPEIPRFKGNLSNK
jgi:hypothetical protein